MKTAFTLENYSFSNCHNNLTIRFNLIPEEPMIRYPNDLAHPGCPAELEIWSIHNGQFDFIDDVPSEDYSRIEEACWEEVESYGDAIQAQREDASESRIEDQMLNGCN